MIGGLTGKRIVNTRAVHQAESLNALLRPRGAIPLDYPCIAMHPPQDTTALDAALSELAAGKFDWLVLTSVNTVLALEQRLSALHFAPGETVFRTAAIGPATTEAAARLGLNPTSLPADYIAEALGNSLPVEPGTSVFLPESALARPTLADLLKARGAKVTVADAYQTTCGQGGASIPQLIAENQIDALTFTSSSTVSCFLERLSREGGDQQAALALGAACIGPRTAATARDCGFTVLSVASEHTMGGLVQALEDYFTDESASAGIVIESSDETRRDTQDG